MRKSTEKIIDLTVESGVWNCPTLIVLRNMRNLSLLKNKDYPGLDYIPKEMVEYWKSSRTINFAATEQYQALLKTLNERGANIISGTDVGNPYIIPGFSLHEEFLLMQEAGLTPYQILLTTTVNPAEMLGISDRLGTIEAGKDADLVLLEENPLEDIANTRTISGVVVKGQWLPSEDIQAMLDEVEESYKR